MLGLVALWFSIAALVIAISKKAGAELPEEYIPTPEQIAASNSLAELQAYYDLIGELLISGYITSATYSALYSTYETRWYELAGVT